MSEINYGNRDRLTQKVAREVSSLRTSDSVIAIACADVHWSHTSPIARSEEKSWYKAMGLITDQIMKLCCKHQAPLIIAGDLLSTPKEPAELINWVLSHLPWDVYAIPGNHDLLHHSYKNLHKSPFYTLVKSGKVKLIQPGKPVEIPGILPIRLHGFPVGFKVKPLIHPHDLYLEVAVIHKYIWMGKHHYHDAPREYRISKWRRKLTGYDIAIFGDNHLGFLASPKQDGCWILNCGSAIRRTSDQINYKPRVGLIYKSGKVALWGLSTSRENISRMTTERITEMVNKDTDMTELLEELSALDYVSEDYLEEIKRCIRAKKPPRSIRDILVRIVESCKHGGLK